jgi:uncharacterized membrane-anchored protein YhcB (DUF1043 family)
MRLDLARSIAAWIGDLFDNQAFVLVVGLALAYVAERFRESRERAEGRRQRRIEKAQEEIHQLQLALAEALHGATAANVAYTGFQARNLARQIGKAAGTWLDDVPQFSELPWYQNWLASQRMAGALTARITDPELRRRADDSMEALSKIHPDREQEFDKRFKAVTDAVIEANERAGELYKELMSDALSPWYRRFWQHSN